jgi:GntR family transcriptional regulator, trigonelline degradation regulator
MPAAFAKPPLVKESLAATLRELITSGVLAPGERIVEGKWAVELGVAQASIREAINLLIAEGFVQKGSGRSARVTKLSERDVAEIYELRASIEGLAARLVAKSQPDLSELDEALRDMDRAVLRGDRKSVVEADLRFHLALCEKSGNRHLAEQARRLLVPLFAFTLMRSSATGQGVEPWREALPLHRRIVDLLKEGEPFLAEQYVLRVTDKFSTFAYDIWENRIRSQAPVLAGTPNFERSNTDRD